MDNETGKSAALGDEQLHTLVQAVGTASASRVPLEVTLAALAEEREDPRLAKVARQLSLQLEGGATIDQAVASLGGQLPAEFAGLLAAGVESGDLSGAVEHFAHQRLAARRSRQRIRAALAYPLLVLAILVPLTLLISVCVLPMFGELYQEFDLELPTITQFVLAVARQMPLMVGILIVIVFVLPALWRLVGGRSLVHQVRSAVPLLGRMWMWSGQREFSAMLSSFLDLRLPTSSAITYTGAVLSDRNLARACRRVDQHVQQGQTLSQSLAQSIHFDRSLVALVAWGERNGMLPDALRVAAEMFDDRIEQRASWLRRMLPPIAMIAIAGLACLVVGSMMIPLVKLIEGLSG
jgi:type II secretory pathway component PulF